MLEKKEKSTNMYPDTSCLKVLPSEPTGCMSHQGLYSPDDYSFDYTHYHSDEIEKTINGFVRVISKTMEVRDPYTAIHQKGVAAISVAIAGELCIPDEVLKRIWVSALLHDLGKVTIPISILSKQGKLSSIEREIIESHARVGYDILSSLELSWPLAEIVYQHHERLDGSGYPRGLSGEDILIEARIIGVADVVEAMSSYRPYRPALGLSAALNELNDNRSILYDPDIVDVVTGIIQKDKLSRGIFD